MIWGQISRSELESQELCRNVKKWSRWAPSVAISLDTDLLWHFDILILLGRVVRFVCTFNARSHPPPQVRYLTLITMSSSKCKFSIKNMVLPLAFMVQINMGGKKSKCENHMKRGFKRCEMMRGFQILPQNLIRTTSEHFLAKKLSKISKIP